MKNSYAYELPLGTLLLFTKLLDPIGELTGIFTGALWHQQPLDKPVRANTTLVAGNHFTAINDLIRTAPKNLNDSAVDIVEILTGKSYPEQVLIEECDSYLSPLSFRAALKLSQHYLTAGYNGALHFSILRENGEYFKNIGHINFSFNWSVNKNEQPPNQISFYSDHVFVLVPLIATCQSLGLSEMPAKDN